MSELISYKEGKCFDKIVKILSNNLKLEIDRLSDIIPNIRNFYDTDKYQGSIFKEAILNYLIKNVEEEKLDKILDFEVNKNDVLVAEILLLRDRK